MNRSEFIQQAAVWGLLQQKQMNRARIIENLQFDEDPLRGGRIVVYIPPNEKASDDVVAYILDSIDLGLKESGYYDVVRIEAPYRGQIPEGSELSLVV